MSWGRKFGSTLYLLVKENLAVVELTPRRAEILQFIACFKLTNRYAPTIREIGAALGLTSTNSVYEQITALEAAGRISTKENKSRTIKIIGFDEEWYHRELELLRGHKNDGSAASSAAEEDEEDEVAGQPAGG